MMRLFLMVIVFICSLSTITLAQNTQMTLEEEDQARQEFVEVTNRTNIMIGNIVNKKDTTGVQEIISELSMRRHEWSNSRTKDDWMALDLGTIHIYLGQFNEALAMFQYVTQTYADSLEAVIASYETAEGFNRNIERDRQLSRESDEYKERIFKSMQSRTCYAALVKEAAMLYRLKRFREARQAYTLLLRLKNKPGSLPNILQHTVLTADEIQLLWDENFKYRGHPDFKDGTSPTLEMINSARRSFICPVPGGFYNIDSTYENMLYLINRNDKGE